MTLPELVVMLSLAPVNEVRLVALGVLLAAALITGPVSGLVSGWSHGRLSRLAGSALGLAVSVEAVVVVALMVEEPSRPQLVLIGPAGAGTPVTGALPCRRGASPSAGGSFPWFVPWFVPEIRS